MNNNKIKTIIDLLAKTYPDAKAELNFSNDYQLIIAVVLSAQCTDKKVNQVTPNLFYRYPNFFSLSQAKITDVEDIIHAVNYYKTKAKNITQLAKDVCQKFQNNLPCSQKDLLSLPGVGRKTANVVQCEKKITPTFPVDTHVFRLAHRLGLSTGKTPLAVETDLTNLFPSPTWHDLHHQFILHGRRTCKAKSPDCLNCVLKSICPTSKK